MASNITSGLSCMNCKKPTQPSSAKLFAEVFICETCYVLADRLDRKIEKELKQLQLLTRDKIREALVTGTFHYGINGEETELLDKKSMVNELVHQQKAVNSGR